MKKSILIGSGLLAVLSFSHAETIIYESFDYTLGATAVDPDGGANGGNGLPATNSGGDPTGTSTGLRNQWNTGEVVAGLNYTGLSTSGNAYRFTQSNIIGSGDNPFVYRSMTTDPFASYRIGDSNTADFGDDGDTLYFSFLMESDSATERAGIILYGGATRYEIGVDFDGSGQISITGNDSGVSYVANETFLIVGQLDLVSGNDTLSLWVNPTIGSALGTADLIDTSIAFEGLSSVSGRYGSNNLILDEFRLGTTLDSVGISAVPEPSSYALIAGALSLAWITVRRRK